MRAREKMFCTNWPTGKWIDILESILVKASSDNKSFMLVFGPLYS